MERERGGFGRSLGIIFVVAIVMIAFAAFFISFLIAPLIVMIVAWLVLVFLDRRHARERGAQMEQARRSQPAEARNGEPVGVAAEPADPSSSPLPRFEQGMQDTSPRADTWED
jgi:Flp pilus assembly protein TadB